jgi:hypothetical protein
MAHWIDNLSDSELYDPQNPYIERLKQMVKDQGTDVRSLLKSIIPDPPLQLSASDIEYGKKVLARLQKDYKQ